MPLCADRFILLTRLGRSLSNIGTSAPLRCAFESSGRQPREAKSFREINLLTFVVVFLNSNLIFWQGAPFACRRSLSPRSGARAWFVLRDVAFFEIFEFLNK
jgi:hypothetical protein